MKLQQLLSISVDPVDCKVLVDVTVKIKDSAVDVEEALFVVCDAMGFCGWIDVPKGSKWAVTLVGSPDVVEALFECVPCVDVENGNVDIPDVVEALCPCVP